MYVCVCNGHRSQDIQRTAREQKLTCAKAIYDVLGGPVCCGTCLDVAQDLIDSVHGTGCLAPHGETPCGLQQQSGANANEAPRRLLAAE
jgi:bacterioferritin-associated ferredoxin